MNKRKLCTLGRGSLHYLCAPKPNDAISGSDIIYFSWQLYCWNVFYISFLPFFIIFYLFVCFARFRKPINERPKIVCGWGGGGRSFLSKLVNKISFVFFSKISQNILKVCFMLAQMVFEESFQKEKTKFKQAYFQACCLRRRDFLFLLRWQMAFVPRKWFLLKKKVNEFALCFVFLDHQQN